jgi:hypothetical protein
MPETSKKYTLVLICFLHEMHTLWRVHVCLFAKWILIILSTRVYWQTNLILVSVSAT